MRNIFIYINAESSLANLEDSILTLPDQTKNTVEKSKESVCIIHSTVSNILATSRYWETHKHSNSKDIFPLLWHSKVNFRVRKVSHWITKWIMIISLHAILLRFILITFHRHIPRPPKWSLLWRFPNIFLYIISYFLWILRVLPITST
jgi:hypothetical protein